MRLLAPFLDEILVAALYETEPVSEIRQELFLNTAVVGRARLAATDLLAVAKAIELLAGRRRGERWGPRALDVDLLLYGATVSRDPELTLPHPRLTERAFYLDPLTEIAPHLRVPPDGLEVSELRSRLAATDTRHRLDWAPLG